MADKHGIDPNRLSGKKSLTEHLQDLIGRVAASETSTRIGHTSVEDGDLTIRNGDLIVSESSGSIVLRLLHGTSPEIRMWPLGESDTHRIAFLGYNGAVEAQSLAIFIETSPDAVIDGGKVLLAKNYAVFSHQPDASGGQETYIWLNGDPAMTESFIFRGRFRDQNQYDTHQALYMGSFVASSGFSTWTHTYAASFDTTFIPLVTVLHSGSTIQWVLDAFSTSSFTVRFSSTANDKTVNFWGFRE